MAGQVRLGTEKIDKASKLISKESKLILDRPQPYVGRGGLKLESFLEKHPLPIKEISILDLGASTGGFTDYLLQKGARTATCVDVGRAQLHYKLRTDPRVINFEKTNLRDLTTDKLEHFPFSIIVMDLSFISLTKVLVRAWSFLSNGGTLISLVKPQFECEKKEADRGRGIIRDELIHQRVLKEISLFAEQNLENSDLIAQEEAIPKGTDGNTEFFLAWRKKG
jgi:23S rRNA (cytidine1920-2'-O)/16S rRNA (cytidine1409-2'-O)-methyltransferase